MKKTALVAALLLSSSIAYAEEGTPREVPGRHGIFLGAQFGYHTPDGTFYGGNFSPGFALNLHGGYRFGEHFSLETGIYEGLGHVKGVSGSTAGVAELLSVDSRFYLPVGSIEPNALLGYTYAAGAVAKANGVTDTFAGPSWNAGLGLRFNVDRNFFFDLDWRHMFIRFTKVRISGSGAGDGTFSTPRQYHGDDDAFLLGGGLQF